MITELFANGSSNTPDPLLERLRRATNGKYDVSGELGRGGMAVVYTAMDLELKRRVAIKVMDPRLSLTEGMAQRFLQEARIAAELEHPNIIVVHEIRQSDEIIYFVMRLIEGTGLDDLCKRNGALPIDQVRWILLQASRALAHAHSEGIVHRDIKPANILLNLKGEVVLTDFGIAKALGGDGLTKSGTQIGTPLYMSPEQFTDTPIGPACDQYALGVTAYQMLAGTTPFTGDMYQLIAAHGNRVPTPLLEVRPDCPAFLANAVMRMLEKRPENRWPTIEDLVEVFGANMAMDGGPARKKLAEIARSLRKTSATRPDAATPVTPHQVSKADSLLINISPPGATIFVGGSLELRALVTLDTGQSLPGAHVTWTTDSPSVLRVNENGALVGLAQGIAVVRATVNDVSTDATIRVEPAPIARLSLNAPSITVRVGDVVFPDVSAVDVNGTPRADIALTWISRSPAIAEMDSPGAIRAIAPGLAAIDVVHGSLRRTIEVTVLRRPIAIIRLNCASKSLELGSAIALGIEAYDDVGNSVAMPPVRWKSSAPSIIHVDSVGTALAISSGSARITATADEAIGSIELESLEPPVGAISLSVSELTLEPGDEAAITLRVKDANGAPRSTAGVRVWSSMPDIAAVDVSAMKVRAMAIGQTQIFASADGNDADASSVVINIRAPRIERLEVFPQELDIEAGAVAAVNSRGIDRRGRVLTNVIMSWTTDSPTVIAVEGDGIVRALIPGTCTLMVSAMNADGTRTTTNVRVRIRRASVARLTVTADRSMLTAGETVDLRVSAWDTMGIEAESVVQGWRTSDAAIARVEGNGRVVALAPGRAFISAEIDGVVGQFSIVVAPAPVDRMAIEPATAEAVVGVPMRFVAKAWNRLDQPASPAIRWSVIPADAGTITRDGEFTAQRAGSASIRADLVPPSDATGVLAASVMLDASATVEVRAPRPISIEFALPSVKLAVGDKKFAVAQVIGEGKQQLANNNLEWSTDSPSVVRVSSTTGEVEAIGSGDANVVATISGVSAAMHVRVAALRVPMSSASRKGIFAGAGVVAVIAVAWVAWAKYSSGSVVNTAANTDSSNAVPTPGPVVSPGRAGEAPPIESGKPAGGETSGGEVKKPLTPPPSPVVKPAPPKNLPPTQKATGGVTTNNGRGAAGVSPTAVVQKPDSVQDKPKAAAQEEQKPPVREPERVVTPPVTPPVTTQQPTPVPAAVTSPAAAPEAASATEVRAATQTVVKEFRARSRGNASINSFLAGGDSPKVLGIVGTPTSTVDASGITHVQFEVSLQRYDAGGSPEKRSAPVTMQVARRNGVAEIVSVVIGNVGSASK